MDKNKDYQLIPLSEITDEAREIAVKWGDEYFPGIAMGEKHKLASDIMNYANEFNKEVLHKLMKVQSQRNYFEKELKRVLMLESKQLEAEKKYYTLRRLNIRCKSAEAKVRRLEYEIKTKFNFYCMEQEESGEKLLRCREQCIVCKEKQNGEKGAS